jgi:two-component system response regulator GlrR
VTGVAWERNSTPETAPLDTDDGAVVRRFALAVGEGPAAGRSWQSTSDRCSLGSDPSNDFMIEDPAVSRFHCEVRVDGRSARVRDLGSRNGTFVDGVRVVEAYLRNDSVLGLGRTSIMFQLSAERLPLELSTRTELGGLVGESLAMRAAFALIERAAQSDATVLLGGETGTGKEVASEAIHTLSSRRDKPLVVVDCGAIPPNLLESELFGHERGSFTGATERRTGAFQAADGGTVFLDEIGELPLDLQPKLLRVLEKKQIRRVGSNQMIPVDVRMVAATNRDLRMDVNSGSFRADLYFRLAVVKVTLPPLRQRFEDLPSLTEHLFRKLRADPAVVASFQSPEFIANLRRSAWPGNVRQLRNYLESCLVFQRPLPIEGVGTSPLPASQAPSYVEGRRRALESFECEYLQHLLRKHNGRVLAAAEDAGVGRAYFYRLLKKNGLTA